MRVSWKEYVDTLWRLHHDEHDHLHTEMKKLNQLRQEVTTDRALFPTKDELSAIHDTLDLQLRTEVSVLQGRIDLLVKSFQDIRDEQSNQRGRQAGYNVAIGVGVSVIAVALRFL